MNGERGLASRGPVSRVERLVLSLALAIASASCASAVTLHSTKPVLTAGEEIVTRFSNGSLYTVWGNLCGFSLERRCDSEWRRAANRELDERECVLLLAPYPSGYESELRARLDPETAPGTYRVVTRIEFRGKARTLASEPFSVGRPAEARGEHSHGNAVERDSPTPGAAPRLEDPMCPPPPGVQTTRDARLSR
jgi:hypothetical protein